MSNLVIGVFQGLLTFQQHAFTVNVKALSGYDACAGTIDDAWSRKYVALCFVTSLCVSNDSSPYMLEWPKLNFAGVLQLLALAVSEGLLRYCLSCLLRYMMPHRMMLCLLHVVMLGLLTVATLAYCGNTCLMR